MRRFLFWGVWAIVLLCCSCTGNQVYDHYQNVPISGWDKADVLSYDVAALRDSGWYATEFIILLLQVRKSRIPNRCW